MSESVQVISNNGRTITDNRARVVMQFITGRFIRVGQLFSRKGNLYNRRTAGLYNRK